MNTTASSNPTIWIVNEAGHDYEKAKEVVPDADIHYLSTGSINPLFFDRMTHDFARGIAKYVKPGDYLLPSGTPPASMSVYILWLLQFGECKLLLWDAKRRIYKLQTQTLDQLRDTLSKQGSLG